MNKTKILMVCLGNICRSPLAEGILRNKLDINKFTIDSTGTGNWHVGNPPDKRSVAVAKKYGIDISGLRGRQFTSLDYQNFDHIYVMDSSNLENVLALAESKEDRAKVSMILDTLFPGEKVDVPDPYYGGDDGFEQVYAMLDEACDVIKQRHT
ncbi:low molecular weight protein-tyrosine-phosphatase [uncultured Dokdonia sp.]|uniref:low molecular weight protein-tyrosine-phosphatase n=1 Tax=uncultured Dokdonia sp. TaxID=575653 RepID=UPI00261AC217|nr:low molecular weight protein-tyrosine-phosphatase [uncultured Dokdonia sp.]